MVWSRDLPHWQSQAWTLLRFPLFPQLCKAQSCSWFVRGMSRKGKILPPMALETLQAAQPLWQVSGTSPEQPILPPALEIQIVLLLFLHINPEFISHFSPSAISCVWSLSLAHKLCYCSYSPTSQGDPNYPKTSIPPLCSYLEVSRDPGQTHSWFCLLVPPPLNSFLCVVLGFLLQTGKSSDPWI